MKINNGKSGIQWGDMVTLARDDIARRQKVQTMFATTYE